MIRNELILKWIFSSRASCFYYDKTDTNSVKFNYKFFIFAGHHPTQRPGQGQGQGQQHQGGQQQSTRPPMSQSTQSGSQQGGSQQGGSTQQQPRPTNRPQGQGQGSQQGGSDPHGRPQGSSQTSQPSGQDPQGGRPQRPSGGSQGSQQSGSDPQASIVLLFINKIRILNTLASAFVTRTSFTNSSKYSNQKYCTK